MNRHTSLLEQAITKYEEVESTICAIEASIDGFNTAKIEKLTRSMNESVLAAKALDEQLSDTFPEPKDKTTRELDQVRKDLIVSIYKKIEALAPRLHALRAIQINELKHLKHGRQTARGYAQQITSQTGGIISASR